MRGSAKIFNSASVPPERCVFCKIVKGEIPSRKVYEDERHIAFLDINPFTRGHTLVCPKAHGETLWDMDETEIGALFATAAKVSRGVVSAMQTDGFRFVQNNGEAANQIVAHVHIHVIPVKMEDKRRFMERMKLPDEEMASIADGIKSSL